MLWLLDAALQAQPHFFSHEWWSTDLTGSVMGQPEPISRSIFWIGGHLASHAALANGLVIAVQASIGICLVLGRSERVAIAASVPWALGIWWVGEGFGAVPTGFALLAGGAPGAVLFYPILGMLAWPRKRWEKDVEDPPSATAVTAVWCAIWSGGAILGLPWRFPPAQVLRANIEQNSLGQPHWLAGPSHYAYRLVGGHPLLIPSLLFVAQLAIGLGVLVPSTRRAAIWGGAVAAVVFWIVVQDLGSLASGGATDPGSGPLLLLLAVTVASLRLRGESHAIEEVRRRRTRSVRGRPAAIVAYNP